MLTQEKILTIQLLISTTDSWSFSCVPVFLARTRWKVTLVTAKNTLLYIVHSWMYIKCVTHIFPNPSVQCRTVTKLSFDKIHVVVMHNTRNLFMGSWWYWTYGIYSMWTMIYIDMMIMCRWLTLILYNRWSTLLN